MNTLLTHRDKKKLFSYLPDVWFLAILLLGWGGLMSTMLFGAWHTVGIVLGNKCFYGDSFSDVFSFLLTLSLFRTS